MHRIKNSPHADVRRAVSVILPEPNMVSSLTSYDLDFRQIRPGKMETRITFLRGAQLDLMDFQSSQAVHQVGAAPTGALTFGIPVLRDVPRWKERPASCGDLLGFGGGEMFDGVTQAGFRGLTFSFREDVLENVAAKIGAAIPPRARQFGVVTAAGANSRLKALAATALGSLHGQGRPLCAELEDEFTCALLLAMADVDPRHADKSAPSSRARVRKRAIEAMDVHAPDELRISEVCALAETSWRTLDRSFREYFGFGPKAYLQCLRLSRVREALVRAGPETKIVDVANHWGFWHMGQFARDYHKMFGERPTETKNSRI